MNMTMDANVWAEQFCTLFPAFKDQQGWMLGWFANAIMTGYDEAIQ